MKTKHIIAIGLLSALAVGLLALGIKSGNKPKVQTSAQIQITDLTNTEWEFNENFAPTLSTNTNWLIEFTSNNQTFSALYYWTNHVDGNLDYFYGRQHTYVHNTNGWINDNYRIINITNGTDTQNTSLINFLYNNATLLNEEATWYNEGFTDGQTIGQAQGYQNGYTAGETAGYQTGYSAGETAGYETGETAGYQTGYTAGETAGYEAGETAGYETGYQAGLTATTNQAYQEGYTNGYGTGWNDADAFDHPIEIAPLMLNILTMPFTFISQAFDVTLWPGTQYEINIGNFIKAMLAIAAILFIIKLFTSGFSIIGNYTNNKTNRDLKVSQTNLNRAKTKQIQDNSNKK